MTPEQLIMLSEETQRNVAKIKHYLDEGLSYRQIGAKFDPPMTPQNIMYYIKRYNIEPKPIKEFND